MQGNRTIVISNAGTHLGPTVNSSTVSPVLTPSTRLKFSEDSTTSGSLTNSFPGTTIGIAAGGDAIVLWLLPACYICQKRRTTANDRPPAAFLQEPRLAVTK